MTTIRHLSRIVLAMLAMTGRVTMLGLSRWTGRGGSYCTIQRFFHTPLPWAAILWVFVRTQMLTPGDDVLLVGDACVVTKAGTETYGVDRFFSSIFGKLVPRVSRFALALVSRSQRQAFPVQVEQVLREPTVVPPPTLPAAKRKPGRPEGSSTQARADAPLNAEHTRLSTMIADLLARIRPYFSVTYLVLDGHFGNHNAVLMARRLGLHLISKLRNDSALSYPYDGPYAGRGPHRIYGERIDPTARRPASRRMSPSSAVTAPWPGMSCVTMTSCDFKLSFSFRVSSLRRFCWSEHGMRYTGPTITMGQDT